MFAADFLGDNGLDGAPLFEFREIAVVERFDGSRVGELLVPDNTIIPIQSQTKPYP